MEINFSKNLIKGKIAELIFEQMFRESEKYTILHYGYEHTLQELVQYRKTLRKDVMEDIKDTPDFILMGNNKKDIYVVEVKYRAKIKENDLKKIATNILKKWNPSWLFVASKDGFYFSPCNKIIKTGKINRLSNSWINKKNQKEYINLLKEFIE